MTTGQGPSYGESAGGQGPSSGGLPVCPRHPRAVSYVRCQRCGRPTCPACQRPASVGIQCVDCVAQTQMQAQRRAPRTLTGATLRQGAPAITQSLIAINIAIHLLQFVFPALQSWGFFVPLLGQYEPWRFLTAAFLHVGIWHIGLNMYALYLVGPTLETVLGRARFLTLYLLAAIGGAVAVLLLASPDSPSWVTPVAGASGAVFGLFAALALTMRRMKRSDSQILLLIAINFALGFMIRGISWQGHLGGLLVGGALAAAYLFAPAKYRKVAAVGASVGMAILLVLLAVAKYAMS